MSRFNRPLQGKRARAGKAVAGCLIGASIAYSQFFYAPQVRLEPVRVAAAQTVTPVLPMPNPAERITVTVTRIADLQPGDAGIPRGLRLLYEMGQDVLRQEGEHNV
jgi:hypothetical protein